MWKAATIMITSLALPAGPARAEFTLEDKDGKLTVFENGKPVLAYNYEPVKPPEGVPSRYERACYIHPVYGLDGDVLTQDFPPDHYHHRGVFWAWPKTRIGDRPADIWVCADIYQRHEKWTAREAGADKAVVGVRNYWSYNDAPEEKVGQEDMTFTVHPADETGRAIDFSFKFTNITDQDVTFLGATGKGYGGFNFRPDANRRPLSFTTIDGPRAEDVLKCETPWADVTSKVKPDGPVSGVAIFQHPKNPGYPHHGWILRHYGFIGACWPHVHEHVLKPGEFLELRYRLCIHRGTAEEAGVAEMFQAYIAEAK